MNLKVLFWQATRRNELFNQIEEYLAWKKLFMSDITYYREVLRDFVCSCGKNDISYVSVEDVNLFKDVMFHEKTPFTSQRSMAIVRDLFRYHGARKRMCLNYKFIKDDGILPYVSNRDIVKNVIKTLTTEERTERNKELVFKRINDPLKWTWTMLSRQYNVKRETAEQIFRRHAHKFVSERQLSEYQKIIRKSYPHLAIDRV